MTLSFTLILTEREWNPDFGGWNCSVLNIPGASIKKIVYDGTQADEVEYKIDKDSKVIRWNVNNKKPLRIAVLVSIDDSQLSTRELTRRWKIIAIIATPIALVLAALITGYFTKIYQPDNDPHSDQNKTPTVNSTQKKRILDQVRERGTLKCGIDGSFQGFSLIRNRDSNGNIKDITGFDADYCRVIAAAIFGEKIVNITDSEQRRKNLDDKIEFIEVPIDKRFEYVEEGVIDVLIRNTSWTAGRDLQYDVEFGSPIFYDEQQILAKSNSGINNLENLDKLIDSDKKLCVLDGTTSKANIIRYIKDNGILKDNENIDSILKVQIHKNKNSFFDDFEQTDSPCNAITADLSQIITNFDKKIGNKNSDYQLVNLKTSIAQELLSPVFIGGDSKWEDIINYSIYATIRATELGISKAKVDEHIENKNLSLERKQLFGIDDGDINRHIGQDIGLDKEFAQYIIKLVGNYYEIFNRNLSENFKEYYPERTLARGSNTLCLYIEDEERLKGDKNQLWTCGGILISPPFTYDE